MEHDEVTMMSEEQGQFFCEPIDQEMEPPLRSKKSRKKKRIGWSVKPADALKGCFRPSDGLWAAFCVPVVIMIIIFIQRGIFPYGEQSFLRTDM